MPYVQGTLLKGEKILVAFHPHKILMVPSIILLAIFIVFAFLGSTIGHYLPSFTEPAYKNFSPFNIISTILLIYGCLRLLHRYVIYRTSEYTITNLRVVMKTGVLTRVALELMLSRLEAVTVEQSFLGQMFNFGTVVLVGVGGTRDSFIYVPKPMYFRQQIQSHRPSGQTAGHTE